MSALNISEWDSIFESTATAARGIERNSQRGGQLGHKWSWPRNITGIGLVWTGIHGLKPTRLEPVVTVQS